VPRRLGQHFLSDPAILDRIVAALDPVSADVVLEIGPGKGALTRRLAPAVARVVAVEQDRVLAARLRGEGAAADLGNVTVVEGDALAVDWAALIASTESSPAPRSFKVVGNIPYYITSPLIAKALVAPLPEVIVFLVQREVAERVTASPGSKVYGALSVGVQAVAAVDQVFGVRRGSFHPVPNVDSAVIRMVPLAQPLVAPAHQAEFRRFVTGLFSQRRKQLGRALRNLLPDAAGDWREVLYRAGLRPDQRAEGAAPQELVRLFHATMR